MLTLLSLLLALASVSAQRTLQWTLVQNGTSGVVPLALVTISPTLMLMYDRADGNPSLLGNPLLLPNGAQAHAALWDLETNTPIPLDLSDDGFCPHSGGALISNGTLVSVGVPPLDTSTTDSPISLRLFHPCGSPTGSDCAVFEDPEHVHLAVMRFYSTGLRIPDGSLMVIGGANTTTFYNMGPTAENSIEFFPRRPGGAGTTRNSQFLKDAEPVNMLPRSFVLPSGNVFMIANNITMIYDIATGTEMRLPDIPNGVRVAHPFDGAAELLPLSPPLYEPTVLVCGGSATDDTRPVTTLTTQDPASNQCSRITLTPEGLAKGWEVELMPDTRIMLEPVMLPTGDVLMLNGAQTGYAGDPIISDSNVTDSNAANPVLRGLLYRTEAPPKQRITQDGLPTSDIPRLYHSSASLTAKGNIMVAGSNPHTTVVLPPAEYPTEFRVEYLNPDFITNDAPRPVIQSAPTQIQFNQRVALNVTIPPSLLGGQIRVSLMDLGYVTHALHANSRLVFLQHTLLSNNTLQITAPPNNNIYPPGPAWLFLVADGVYSEGVQVMVGDGGDPPRANQGVKIPVSSL
ncbi:glyoxal oxidase precursor [Mycena vulgaris]|nr:glyoxal oxidase precursor [Mycena vulgaris]